MCVNEGKLKRKRKKRIQACQIIKDGGWKECEIVCAERKGERMNNDDKENKM